MTEPFFAEIRMVGFNFAPRGWSFCDGQILPINQNQSLYALLGTTYGGDGRTSFALPDLRGRTPIHDGQSEGGTLHPQGQQSGEEAHPLTIAEIPQHQHTIQASADNTTSTEPAGTVFAKTAEQTYHSLDNPANMGFSMLAAAGGGQPRPNMQPFIAVNFCIALQGLFPSRN